MADPNYIELVIKSVGGLVALSGAYVAFLKYIHQKSMDGRTARIESRRPYTTKKQEIYFDLVTTTATIGNWNQADKEWETAANHFWVLFWGPVPIIADEDVAKALDVFAEVLDEHPQNGVALRNASMNLARACRKSLGISWNADLESYDISARASRSQQFSN